MAVSIVREISGVSFQLAVEAESQAGSLRHEKRFERQHTMFAINKKGWIGVDIGTHAVKLAQVEREGMRLVLSEAVVIQRDQPWTQLDGEQASPITSSEELIAARSLGERFLGRSAAATAPMAVCEVRSMNVAANQQSDASSIVAHEMAGLAGNVAVQRVFDFWQTDNAEESTSNADNVCVLSMSTEWADRIARDHSRARLVCKSLDGVPLALARALYLTGMTPDLGPVAAIDWGYSQATFCIVISGRPIYVRRLRDGGFGQVVRAICDTFSITHNEAGQLIANVGISPPGKGESTEAQVLVTEVVTDATSRFIEEIERTLSYLKGHRQALFPQKMILLGGGATMKNAAEQLTAKLKLPTEPWSFNSASFQSQSAGPCPTALLGPAIALSSLKWQEN